jgi:esterase/lipase
VAVSILSGRKADALPPMPPRTSLLKVMAEASAVAEIGSFYGVRRLLERRAPRGDGHPVMVLPGFMASDTLTQGLRSFLAALGYEVHAWELGRNPGLRLDLCEKLEKRIARIRATTGRRVSLIGWSLGGMYARAIAHRQSEHIRQVITLGTPFNINVDDAVGGAIARVYVMLNPQASADPLMASGLVRHATPVPSTSIFSVRDGIVPWHRCVEQADERTECIRIPGSHCGMTYNPVVLSLVAERLSQREHGWRPFRPSGLKALVTRPFRHADP